MLTQQDLSKIRGIIRQENKGFVKRDEVREIIRQENKGLARREEVREIVREEVGNIVETKVRPVIRDEVRTEVSSQLKKELRPIRKDIKLRVRFFDQDITHLKQRMTRAENVLQLSPLPHRNGAEL